MFKIVIVFLALVVSVPPALAGIQIWIRDPEGTIIVNGVSMSSCSGGTTETCFYEYYTCDVHGYYQGQVMKDGAYSPWTNLWNCVIPCDLTSVAVSSACSGDCDQGENIDVTANYLGDCSNPSYLQVNASSSDNTENQCVIEASGSGIGYMQGIQTQCSSSPCNQQWTIPSVPLACKGKTVTVTAAGIYESNWPPGGTLQDSISDATGSFKFSINPAIIDITIPMELSDKEPNCHHSHCPEITLYVPAKIWDTNTKEEINCDSVNCQLTSIKIDGVERISELPVTWDSENKRWEITIDTEQHHSNVEVSVDYSPSGTSASNTTTYGVNYPPEITNVYYEPDPVLVGDIITFYADVTDPDGVSLVRVCEDTSCNSVYSGCEDMSSSGDTYSCFHVLESGDSSFYIVAEDTKGAVSAAGASGSGGGEGGSPPGGGMPIDSSEYYVELDIVYPDLEAGLITTTETGEPNFTRTMPVKFIAAGTIKSTVDPGYSYPCDDENCVFYYDIGGEDWKLMEWDAFKAGWYAEPDSSDLNCDTSYTINVKADLGGIETTEQSSFFVSCTPKLIVEPVEKRLALGDSDLTLFTATIYNPRDARQYELTMSAIRSDGLPLGWINFVSNGDSVTMDIAAKSSYSDYVYIDQAYRAGIYPIKFTALSPPDGSEIVLESTGTVMIFGESLSEFALWQVFVMMLFALLLFSRAFLKKA